MSEEQDAALVAVARADGVPIAEVARTAIDGHVASRREDREFQERLTGIIERDCELLERLAQ
jgi:hypothetical protein